MAELDVGKHCSVASCNLLDFLPIVCDGCGESFCKDHSDRHGHGCSECKEASPDRPIYDGPKSFKCTLLNCKGKELTPITCEACGKNFCLAHRHQVDHNCENYVEPTERMSQTAQSIQKLLDSKESKEKAVRPNATRKSEALAAKVTLMKIKMKAAGDASIPESERTYFLVYLPIGAKEKSKPMFFSKVWTIGKIVDKIASTCGLQNDNNVAQVKKLRLFKHHDGALCQASASLASFLQTQELFNGGSVIVEYVQPDVINLDALHNYKAP